MDIADQIDLQNANRIRLKEFRLGRFCVPLAILIGALLLLVLPTSFFRPAHGQAMNQQAASGDGDIKALINLLGSPDHLVREQSEKSLLEIGESAIDSLQAVLNFEDSTIVPDNEIRLRVTRLLVLIQRKAQQRKLAEFLNGTRDEIDLAGWADFKQIVGSEPASRRLFIKLHQSRSKLLDAPAKGQLATENELHTTIFNWIRLSSNGNAETVINNLAAVLFSATRKTKWNPGQPAVTPQVVESDTKRIQKVLIQPQMITTLDSHVAGAEIKTLILHWLDSLQLGKGSPKHVATVVSVIDAYQLRKKSELPLRFALDSKLSAHLRSTALAVLSRVGSADDATNLQPLLSDSTVVGNYLLTRRINKDAVANGHNSELNEMANPLLEVQIRDLALAASIILQEKPLNEFGFYSQAIDDKKLVINQAGFLSETQRESAFSRWEELSSPEKKN